MIEHANCRRHAPVAIYDGPGAKGLGLAKWPEVNANDWCGEHEPLITSQPEKAG